MLQSMGLQRVGYDWVTELNWLQSQLQGKRGIKKKKIPCSLPHWLVQQHRPMPVSNSTTLNIGVCWKKNMWLNWVQEKFSNGLLSYGFWFLWTAKMQNRCPLFFWAYEAWNKNSQNTVFCLFFNKRNKTNLFHSIRKGQKWDFITKLNFENRVNTSMCQTRVPED